MSRVAVMVMPLTISLSLPACDTVYIATMPAIPSQVAGSRLADTP